MVGVLGLVLVCFPLRICALLHKRREEGGKKKLNFAYRFGAKSVSAFRMSFSCLCWHNTPADNILLYVK